MIFFTDDNLPLFTYCMCTHTLLKSISRERERELKRVFFKRMRYKYNVKIRHKLIRTVQHQQLSLNIFFSFSKKDQFTLSIDSKSQQQQKKTEPIENIYLYFNKIKSIKISFNNNISCHFTHTSLIRSSFSVI